MDGIKKEKEILKLQVHDLQKYKESSNFTHNVHNNVHNNIQKEKENEIFNQVINSEL